MFHRGIVYKKLNSICFISCFSHVTNFIKVGGCYSSRSLIKPELTICLLDSLCTNDIALLLINRQRVHKCLHSLIRAKISAYSVRVYKVTFSTDSYLSTLLLSAICFKLLETLAKLGDTLPEVLHVLHCTSIRR